MKDVRFVQSIVIGAGPAGLGAATGLARKGIGVTLIEQNERPGLHRRGETIRFNQDMEDILGRGLFDRIARCRINRRRYYSHSGRRLVDRTISNANIIFNWPDLIGIMSGEALKAGVRILTGTRAEKFLEREGRVEGIIAEKAGERFEMDAALVVSCGGYQDPASYHLNLDRSRADKAVSKMLVKGYEGPDDRLEYHFHIGRKGLVVGAIFPRGDREAEVILLDTAGSGEPLSFDEFAKIHAPFGERIRGTEPFYKLETLIPMGGMIYPFMPRPGLAMAGDALGHVQARGGSGIRTSFLIGHAAGTLGAGFINSEGSPEEKRIRFEKALMQHPEVKSLRMHNLIYLNLRKRIFGLIGTPEKMDRFWPGLELALR